jgi:CRP/FNR family transcriptional regulator, cyclic AMP receptor protein
MLRKNAKVELLKSVPLFRECSNRELNELASLADELELPAGRKLTAEGASGKEFIVIVDGAAEVHRKGQKVANLRSGDFLGEIALITGEPRTATVTTTKPSRLLVITAQAFRTLLRDLPSLQFKVLEALASRLPKD